jgi:O-antigen/teichoic acid export membrane protein
MLGQNVLQLALVILLLSLGFKLYGVIIAFIITSLIIDVIGFTIIVKQIGFHWPHFTNMKAYLKWGIPLTPNTAIQWIISQSDRYIINFFWGVSFTGIYSAAYSIGNYASFVLYPIGIVLFPIISRKYDEGKIQECEEYLTYSLKYLMMIVIPAAVGLSILSTPLLHILTTPAFISGNIIVPFIAFSAVLFCFFQIAIYVIQLVGKTYITVRLLGSSAMLNVILNIILVPRIGILGAAIGSSLAYGFLGVITIIITRRYLKYKLNGYFMVKSLLSSSIMALVIWLIEPKSLLMVALSIIIGTIIYFVVLFLVRGFSRQEISFFIHFLQSQIRRITSSLSEK